MNRIELKNIILNYYSYNDALKAKLMIDKNQKYDLVIVSPTWKPHFVFNDEYKVNNLKTGSTSTYELKYNNKKILFLKTGKGAPNLYDNLLLLHEIESPYLFLGSTGSFDENIKVGDIVLPDYSISGDGASLYFNDNLDDAKLFNKVLFEGQLKKDLINISNDLNIELKKGNVFSTDSLIGEYYHLDEIKNKNVSCIEQETAAFGKCMEIMEKDGVPLLVTSDSLVTGQNYYESLDNKPEYIETRTKKLQKIINRLY